MERFGSGINGKLVTCRSLVEFAELVVENDTCASLGSVNKPNIGPAEIDPKMRHYRIFYKQSGETQMKWISIIVLVGLCAPAAVRALPKSHSPFFPNENYTLSLDTCLVTRNIKKVHPAEGTISFYREGDLKLVLNMVDFHYTVQIHNDSGQVTKAVDVDVTMPSDVVKEAFCTDLNKDGTMDFVVTLWGHGNGLGAQFYNRLIALSSEDGFRFWVVPTMTPSADDFVTFGEFMPIGMVTTAYVNSSAYSDPPHSYFIFDLWTFRDGGIIFANHVDPRFPKWVWNTSKDNHKPATSLDELLKERLRDKHVGPREVVP